MINFDAARRMMVDGQVRTADVTDPRLLSAMLGLPRERFFPEDKASLAYLDIDVPVSAAGLPVRRLRMRFAFQPSPMRRRGLRRRFPSG